jgi:hypothetical protein
MNTITLNFTNYIVTGNALIVGWYGETGSIQMDKIIIKDDEELKNLSIEHLNDGDFGCQRIKGASVTIYKNFEGHLVHHDNLIIGNLTNEEIDFLLECGV